VENRTADVSADKSPEEIEREMERTRDSITEKVAALENQVIGTIQTATSTVSDTVNAVKEAVSSAPHAVKETVMETVNAVKETVTSFSVSECVSNNPWAAVGTSAAGGFLLGFLLPAGRGGLFNRPIMAKGSDAPAGRGQAGTSHHGATSIHAAAAPTPGPAAPREPEGPGLFGGLFGMVANELRQLAEQAINTGLATLKQSLNTQVPNLVDSAVHKVTDRVNGLVSGTCESRVGGPEYRATPPAAGV